MKKAINHICEKSDLLMPPLFMWTVLSSTFLNHKLDWIDASFLIAYTFLARSKI